MIHKLDYNNDSVMQILNNDSYTEEQKKELFEKYKKDLKEARKREIINRLNECAKNIPTITKEIYISFLKEYENDNLTKPFEVIEEEIKIFENRMKAKYDEYLKLSAQSSVQDDTKEEIKVSEEITPDVKSKESEVDMSEDIDDEFDDTMFKDPEELSMNDISADLFNNDEVSVLNEEPELLAKPLNNVEKEVMPEELPEPIGEKGNASAIILSIIAIIIGAVVMYSIIRLN